MAVAFVFAWLPAPHPQNQLMAVAMGFAGLAVARPERGQAGLRPLDSEGESRWRDRRERQRHHDLRSAGGRSRGGFPLPALHRLAAPSAPSPHPPPRVRREGVARPERAGGLASGQPLVGSAHRARLGGGGRVVERGARVPRPRLRGRARRGREASTTATARRRGRNQPLTPPWHCERADQERCVSSLARSTPSPPRQPRVPWPLGAVPFGGRLDGWGSGSRSAIDLRPDHLRVITEVALFGVELVRPPTRKLS
jgi:hypothetical protein